MRSMNDYTVYINKIVRILKRKAEAFIGLWAPLNDTLVAMAIRPFELHLELTNLCNAKCIFCPYQFQKREIQFMADPVFYKTVSDYCNIGGGSVGLTPIVGDALIDPKFIERVKFLRQQPEIDRIFLTTNGILLDKFGIDAVLNSGLSSINISTSGFDKNSYFRVYKSTAYERMKENVTELVAKNAKRRRPLNVVIAIRTDRTMSAVMNDVDFQPILYHKPEIDFTWSYTTANGRITKKMLPRSMRLRSLSIKKEACVQTYNGPIILPDGDVLICSCVAAVDGVEDLKIGSVLDQSLLSIWNSEKTKRIRASFGSSELNSTCKNCDMYRNLDLYRTQEGRERGSVNSLRSKGKSVVRQQVLRAPFSGA